MSFPTSRQRRCRTRTPPKPAAAVATPLAPSAPAAARKPRRPVDGAAAATDAASPGAVVVAASAAVARGAAPGAKSHAGSTRPHAPHAGRRMRTKPAANAASAIAPVASAAGTAGENPARTPSSMAVMRGATSAYDAAKVSAKSAIRTAQRMRAGRRSTMPPQAVQVLMGATILPARAAKPAVGAPSRGEAAPEENDDLCGQRRRRDALVARERRPREPLDRSDDGERDRARVVRAEEAALRAVGQDAARRLLETGDPAPHEVAAGPGCARLREDDARRDRLVDDQGPDLLGEARVDRGGRAEIGAAGERAAGAVGGGEQRIDEPVDERPEDRALVREVEVEGPARDAGRGRDALDAGPAVAVAAELLERGGLETRALGRLVVLSPAHGRTAVVARDDSR